MSTISGEFIKFDTKYFYKITDKQKDKIIKRLMIYYITNCHDGEGIQQDDDSLIEAPLVLSDICDNYITFKTSDEMIEERK